MSLTSIKSAHQAKNTQFVIFNSNGIIIESDNVLFSLNQEEKLTEIHPFFENVLDIISAESIAFSCVHLNINSTLLTCDIEIYPIENNNYLLILIDFSKHYKSFQSLAQSRNETAIQSEILVIKNEILREKEAFKNKFIDNFSHEITSPITSIIAFANLMKNSKLNNEQKEYLEVMTSSSLHLKSMINDVLDISKLEIGKLEINNEQFNFSKLLSQIESEYNHKCAHKQLEFKLFIDDNVPIYIESDKTKIRQVIKNLLDNAIKFTSTGSISLSIKTIFTRAQRITLGIVVEDTGTGIKEEDKKSIFTRFNRLGNATHIDGVGLGLSIVKEITELLGGIISVKSELKKGSCFSLTIKAKYPPTQKIEIHKNSKKLFKKNKQKHQVLVVEDNELHQLAIFKILAKTNNFYLDIVSNGSEALEAVNSTLYDVILMDYKMPILNGLETAKAIRNLSDKRRKNIPILIATGAHIDTELLGQKGKDINDIITKPFDEEEFISAIESCLSNN
ncbi:MAG: hypothetical protein COA88_00015 [Kordia sp.]|nr:MAG: hypothetical protein COA88_00015 [Kordia sp.]